jgi:diguanylate cyclase (GGDEF)-like protein
VTHDILKRSVLLGTTAILCAFIGGAAFVVSNLKERALVGAGAQLEQSGRVVSTVLNRHILQIDSALAGIPTLVSFAGRDETDPNSARMLLQGLNFQAFVLRDLLLLSTDGKLWTSARSPMRNLFTPEDEALLASLRPGASRLIGPIRNPSTSEWTLFIARRVVFPGQIEKIAVAEVPHAMLTAQLAPIADTPGLQIILQNSNDQILARLPHDELQIGVYRAAAAAIDSLDGVARRNHGADGDPDSLSVRVPTLYADLRATLTLDQASALMDWRRDRDRVLIVLIVAITLMMMSSLALLAALRRHRRLDDERQQAQTMLEDAIAAMADGFVMWDADDKLVNFNQHFLEIYEKSAPFLKVGASFEHIMREGVKAGQYPQAGDDVEGFIRRTVAWHHAGSGVIERLLPDGRWILITERRTANGGTVGIRTDITEFKRLLADLATANERVGATMAELQSQNAVLLERDAALLMQNMLFDAAINNMSHGLMMVDADERLIVCNRQLTDLFELGEPQTVQGAQIETVFLGRSERSDANRSAGSELVRRLRDHAAHEAPASFVITDTDGRALGVSARPMRSGGFVAIVEDVTERRRAEHQIVYIAHHDALTGLPNRLQFRNSLDQQMARLARTGQQLALLYLDLDRFKQVNDTMGHTAGDRLLEQVATRLRGSLRGSDMVARLGGDEFAITFVCDDAASRAEMLARSIIRRLAAPYELDGCRISVGVSIGGAMTGANEVDADTLLKNADMALYAAKNRGRGLYCIFEPDMATRLQSRFVIETDLKTAIGRSEFEIAYQPLFGLKENRVTSFEALLRWNHPTRGGISPAEFIPLAEETGVINEIGAWCLERACSDMASMPGNIMIAVNVSPVQLKSADFFDVVTNALARSGLPPTRLELEITESALLDDDDRILAHLHRLNGMGVHIVLDDFGTGYSSLNYLRRFPFHKIKIDKVFITEATERADCSDIIRSIVELSVRLDMSTTAEGIETTEQLELVRSLGCDEAQGFLLGRPGSLLNAVTILAAEQPAPGRPAVPARAKPDRLRSQRRRPASRRAVND